MVWVQRPFEFIVDEIRGLQLVLDLYRTPYDRYTVQQYIVHCLPHPVYTG